MTALALTTPAISIAGTTVRQITYTFTTRSDRSAAPSTSADPAEGYYTAAYQNVAQSYRQTSGTRVYDAGPLSEKGTITVGIVGTQQDGGLIVSTVENGQSARRSPAAECVVYGNTRVLCDPKKTVYPEEYTLLRFLGRNFIDTSNLDAHRHWHIFQNSPSMTVTADYTVGPATSGDVTVSETRTVRQPNDAEVLTDVQTKIGYDMSRNLPTSIDESVTQRHDNGVQGTSTTVYQTTLSLVSDVWVEP